MRLFLWFSNTVYYIPLEHNLGFHCGFHCQFHYKYLYCILNHRRKFPLRPKSRNLDHKKNFNFHFEIMHHLNLKTKTWFEFLTYLTGFIKVQHWGDNHCQTKPEGIQKYDRFNSDEGEDASDFWYWSGFETTPKSHLGIVITSIFTWWWRHVSNSRKLTD